MHAVEIYVKTRPVHTLLICFDSSLKRLHWKLHKFLQKQTSGDGKKSEFFPFLCVLYLSENEKKNKMVPRQARVAAKSKFALNPGDAEKSRKKKKMTSALLSNRYHFFNRQGSFIKKKNRQGSRFRCP